MGACLVNKKSDNSELKYKSANEEQNQPEYCDQKIVCNQDLFRITKQQLLETLHRSIGALVFLNRNKQRSVGSGTLISNDLILTAAHNIYDQRLKCQYTSFKFYLGADGEADQYHEVQVWRYPEEFKTCPQSAKMPYDYGVMKLKRPVQLGKYMQLSLPCQQCLKSKEKEKEVHIFGFPSTHGNFAPLDQKGNRIKLAQYGLTRKDRVISVDDANFKISYGISTLPGQSGCPVSVDDTIIAVHVGGDKEQFNVGRTIDHSLIYNLKIWEVELKAAPFAIKTENLCSYLEPRNLKLARKELKKPSDELKTIRLELYPNLMRLDLRSNKLQSIDLSRGPHLTSIQLASNQIKTINTSSNIFLTHLDLHGNMLSKIDLSCNKDLSILNLGENKLLAIDLRGNVRLTELWLYSNKLKQIDLRLHTQLRTLWLSQNHFSSINLINNQQLIELSLHHNNLTSVDLTNNQNLASLRLNDNLLAEIDLSKHQKLKQVFLYNNNLSKINLRNSANIQKLLLDSNKLSIIDMSISEHVPFDAYANLLSFRFDHQDTLSCKIRLAYSKPAILDKAIKICEKWKQSYSPKESNQQQCKYTFQIY